jgi:hypothetical protein
MNSKLILLFLVIFVASTSAFAQTATEPSGDGSESTPYQVSTLDHLYWITQNSSSWDKIFEQTADIDASSTSGWDDGDGWSPIGDWDVAFSGSYDGGNFSISGLTINRSSSNIGMFGKVGETAVITQVVLVDVSIDGGYDYIGALVGDNDGMVSNSHMSGSVHASEDGYYVGGLVGYNEGTVHQSSASGEVNGRYGAGGLVGGNYGTITQSFATGNVISNDGGNAGGLVGANGGPITNSYATGNVRGDDDTYGGLIGEQYGDDDEVENTYAVGIVRGPSRVGGLIGYNDNTVLNSYWLSDTGNEDNGYGTALNGTAMRQEASFTGFDFTGMWDIAEGETYPTLQGNPQTPAPGGFPVLVSPDNQAPAASRTPLFTWLAGHADSYEIQVSISDDFSSTIVSVSDILDTEYQLGSTLDAGETYYWRIRGYDGATPQDWTDVHSFTTNVFTVGNGTSGNPYQISTAIEFNSLRNDLTAHYVLTADIDLSEFSNDGAGFEPIGSTSPFTGVLDGGGHAITGLHIYRPEDDQIGLFSQVGASGEVKRLGLLDVSIEGNEAVGGLIGWNNGGLVSECYVTGFVVGQSSVGGLIGSAFEAQIINNYTLTSTYGSYHIGGLIGTAEVSTITNNVVSGTYLATEFGGYPIYGSEFDNVFSNNYWDTHPADNELLGGTRLDAVEMRTQNSFVGFDFTTIWQIDESRSFPYLRNNTQSPSPGNSPTLDGPENGLTGVPVLPEFTWTNVPTFDHYTLQVSATSDFDEVVMLAENVTELSYQSITELEYGTQYYWRVVGYLDDEQSNWSQVRGFTTTYFANGSGTSEDPYQISTAELLDAVRFELDAHYILTADIDLSFATSNSSGIFWNNGRGFDPIGYESAFTGVFDGDGHIISGLHINRPYGDNVNDIGLFGNVGSTGEIKRVGLVDVDIDANFNLGGLVGENRGTITENFVTGDITGQGNIGGLVGISYNGTISNNYTQTNTSGNRQTSGLIGMTNNDVISHNYVFGTYVQEQSTPKAIYNNGSTASASNNYWFAGDAVDDDATAVGLTSAQMRQEESFVGFDFTNTWSIFEGYSYPYLQAFDYDALPGFVEPESLVSGKSLAFDSGTLTVPHNEVYNDLDAMTFEAWLYPEDLSIQRGIIEKHQSPTSGWWVRTSSTGKIQALFVVPGTNASATTTASLQLNTWQHLVVMYDGTGVKIYIDGQLQVLSPSTNGTGTITNNTRDIQIGKLNWVSGSFFDGNMDEIRIWDKALTDADIRQNMFQKLNGDEDGLIAYYPLDEIDGSLVIDKTGNNDYSLLDTGVTQSDETHPYGTFITGDEGWRIMSSPVGATFADLLAPVWTQGFPGSDSPDHGASNVHVWDEAARQFTSVADASDSPSAGTGFITYVFDDVDYDGTPDGFPKQMRVENAQRSGSVNPTLSYTESGEEDERGWNLVGNPYGATIDWDAASGLTTTNLDATVYVWNSEAGDYQTWNGLTGTLPNGLLAPWQGFWVKANAANPEWSITDESRSAGGIMRKENPTPVIRFSLEGDGQRSSTVVMLSDQAEVGKDRWDAYKLQSLKTDYVSLFTQMDDGTALDIHALPIELLDVMSIPLDVAGNRVHGEFELTWDLQSLPDDWTFKIRDNESGVEYDLMEQPSISIQISNGEQSDSVQMDDFMSLKHEVMSPKVMKTTSETTSRFTLIITPGNVTSVESILLPKEFGLSQNFPNPFNPSTVIGFQLPVDSRVDLRVYDILGREVTTLVSGTMSAGRHSVTFNAENLASGMYIYRLVAGNTVLTKKLTLIK